MLNVRVRFVLTAVFALLLSACGNVTPTPDAMMQATATPDAMMHDTATPSGMAQLPGWFGASLTNARTGQTKKYPHQ